MAPLSLSLGADEPHSLGALIDLVVDRQYGGIRTRLAEAMGLSLSYLGKVVSHQEAMGPENVLKFAKIAGLPPAYCLAVAGHADLLALIQDGFGREARGNGRSPLDDDQRALLVAFARLTTTQRAALLAFLQAIRPST